LRKWLGNAFTVGDVGAPCDEDLAALERLAQFIVTRNLEAPAILFLQSAIPISFIGSQVMVALEPIIGPFWPHGDFERLARIFERRDGIERLTKRIEQLVEEKDAELKKG
jgi:hypothetical protein